MLFTPSIYTVYSHLSPLTSHLSTLNPQLSTLNPNSMKAMTKTQLAMCAGVHVSTLSSWLKPYEEELTRMGYPPGRRCIPPNVVAWICERFCIEVT